MNNNDILSHISTVSTQTVGTSKTKMLYVSWKFQFNISKQYKATILFSGTVKSTQNYLILLHL